MSTPLFSVVLSAKGKGFLVHNAKRRVLSKPLSRESPPLPFIHSQLT